ncbi:MAG: hypothetical protein H0W71_04200 [Sphingomonas sp.]|nr:hypothetical protein [Sphingomonas sp.]
MIYKRFAARLKAQDWLAITIEIAIVIIGVFVGTQVANWNEQRLENVETQRMLTQLKPEVQSLLKFYTNARSYYSVTRGYAATAFNGWRRDPKVSDRDFVIAAYQASQIAGIGTNNETWATIFGADRLRTIDDPVIRDNLAYLMSGDTKPIDAQAVDTPYRHNVRSVIPVEIQDAIRAKCGDRNSPEDPQIFYLPQNCDLIIPPAEAAEAAAALRARPQLSDDLRWHTAAVAAFLDNLEQFETRAKTLAGRISTLK